MFVDAANTQAINLREESRRDKQPFDDHRNTEMLRAGSKTCFQAFLFISVILFFKE